MPQELIADRERQPLDEEVLNARADLSEMARLDKQGVSLQDMVDHMVGQSPLMKAAVQAGSPVVLAQQLNAKQSNRFWRTPVCTAPTLAASQIKMLDRAQEDENTIGLARSTTGSAGDAVAVAVGDEAVATFSRVTFTPHMFELPFRATTLLRDTNIEHGQLIDTLIAIGLNRMHADGEEIIWQSNTAAANPAGWPARMGTSINGLRVGAAAANLVNWNAAVVTFRLFELMIDALPNQWQMMATQKASPQPSESAALSGDYSGDGPNLGRWRFYCNPVLQSVFVRLMQARATSMGDAFILRDDVPYYRGIPIISTCGIPVGLVGTGTSSGHTDADLTYMVLTQEYNPGFRWLNQQGVNQNIVGVSIFRHPYEYGKWDHVMISSGYDIAWRQPAGVVLATNVPQAIP